MTEKEIDKQKLLEQIRDIRKAKKDGKLVIFVGAGVSKNSYLPDWEDLIKAIAQKLDYNNCSNCIFDEKSCRKCGKSLKDDCDNCKYKYKFSQDDYLKVPQYLYNKYGKRSKHKYYNVIKEFFDKPVKSNHIHNTILEIFPHHIITTNYDHLLEEVNHINTNSYQVIKNDNDLLKTYRPKYIIKMHGDLSDIKNIVLKEQDYIEYSHKHTLIETFIKSLLIDHTFLFVGYSLNDNNIKLILGWINFIAKQSKKEERAKNYLITAIDNNKYDKLKETYLNNQNIEIINQNIITEKDILVDNSNLEPYAKKLNFCLRLIIDDALLEKYETSEQFWAEELKDLESYNYVSCKDLLNTIKVGSYTLSGNQLQIYDEKKYNKLVNILNANNKNAFIINKIFRKTNIEEIYYDFNSKYSINKITPSYNEEDNIFNAYLNNEYLKCIRIINQSTNTLLKTYYLSVLSIESGNLLEIIPNFEALSEKNTDIQQSNIVQFIIFSLNRRFIDALKFLDVKKNYVEIDDIWNMQSDYFKKYNQYIYKFITFNFTEEINQLNEHLGKHKDYYLEDQQMILNAYTEFQYGYIKKMQPIVYDYYFFMKRNYIMIDNFSNPKTFFLPYITAIIISCSKNVHQPDDNAFFKCARKEKYPLNIYDVDIITRYCKHKDLENLIQEYKISNFTYSCVNIVDLFNNLCQSFKYFHNYNNCNKFNNFCTLLANSELNEDDKIKVINSINELISFLIDLNVLKDLLNIYEGINALLNVYSSLENDCLFKLFSLLTNQNVIELSINDKGSRYIKYSSIIYLLRKYKDKKIENKIINMITSKKGREVIDLLLIFDYFLDKQYACELYNKYFNDIYYAYMPNLIFQGYIKFNEEIINGYIKRIEEEISIRKADPRVKTYPDHIEESINHILYFILKGKNVNIEQLRPYIEYSDYLDFILNPDTFDYSKIDIMDVMWLNFFLTEKYQKIFKEHSEELLSESLIRAIQNDTLTSRQSAILFGKIFTQDQIERVINKNI